MRVFNLVRDSVADLSRLLDLITIVPSGRRRLRLCAVWFALVMKLRLGIEREWRFALEWQGPRSMLKAAFSDVSELWVLRELFVAGEYRLPEFSPDVIVDLGSNVGLSVLYFREMYPAARIVAVEANPRVFARLHANVGNLPGVTLVHAAVGDREGTVTFHSGPESWGGSVHAHDAGGRPVTQQLVPALTLEHIMERAGEPQVDLLKMDVEGSEVEILKSSIKARQANIVVFEFHQEYADEDVWHTIGSLSEFELVRLAGDSAVHPLVTLRRRSAVG
jgi:FkbM family methyltransferase